MIARPASPSTWAGFLVDNPDEPLVFVQVREWLFSDDGTLRPAFVADDVSFFGLMESDAHDGAPSCGSLFCIVAAGDDREPFVAAARAELGA